MKYKLNSPFVISLILTSLLFILVFVLSKPIINSDEDIFCLYTLSGSTANGASPLLHLAYFINYALSWPVYFLFKLNSSINWFTLELIVFAFFSSINIFYWFFKIFDKRFGLLYSFLFFLFFQLPFLLSLNISNTSFITAISGASGLLFYYTQSCNKVANSKKLFVTAIGLLIISGLLRIHALLLFSVLILWIGYLVLDFGLFRKFALSVLIPCLVTGFLAVGQNYFYKAKIPGWTSEENRREAYFYISNHANKEINKSLESESIKNAFIRNCFLYDSNYITKDDIDNYIKGQTFNRIESTNGNMEIIFSSMEGYKVYLFLFFTLLIGLSLCSSYLLKKWVLMTIGPFFLIVVLFLFFKLTNGIYITIFYAIFLNSLLNLKPFLTLNKKSKKLIVLLLLLNIPLILYRSYKINETNKISIEKTTCLFNELKTNSNLLFIATDMNFSDEGFSIWNTPSKYPLNNMINFQFFINNSYERTLSRFNIKSLLLELPYKSNIVLMGEPYPQLTYYYAQLLGIRTKLIPNNKFKCLKGLQLSLIR